MDTIIKQVSDIYDWSSDYADLVIFEYERFLELRNENETLSPSDDIDRVWHQHILNTRHYEEYCKTHFSRLVHHDPTDSLDQVARMVRLKNTINTYLEKFKIITNKNIWLPNLDNKTIDLIWTNIENKASEIQEIYVHIIYTFDQLIDNTDMINPLSNTDMVNISGNIIFNSKKIWHDNNNPYDTKLVSYQFSGNDTVYDLKNHIFEKTGHVFTSIKIYTLNNNIKYTNPAELLTEYYAPSSYKNDLDNNTQLLYFASQSITLLAVLEETV
jgi:hypothetical protein